MPTSDRSRLRETFDEVPQLYDRVRPTYPDALFADLERLSALPRSGRVLEVGCGTGQATRGLARLGHEVLCVELGEGLAALARERLADHPNVEIVAGAFEKWDPQGRTFDLVFAATSWHWLDPHRRYVLAAGVLAPSGALSVVTTHHVLPLGGDPFFVDIREVYNSIGESDSSPPLPDEVQDQRDDIESSGVFSDVQVRRYLCEHSYSADEYLSLLDTYSGHRAMPDSERRVLYDAIRRRLDTRPDSMVRKHYLFVLHVARRAIDGTST